MAGCSREEPSPQCELERPLAPGPWTLVDACEGSAGHDRAIPQGRRLLMAACVLMQQMQRYVPTPHTCPSRPRDPAETARRDGLLCALCRHRRGENFASLVNVAGAKSRINNLISSSLILPAKQDGMERLSCLTDPPACPAGGAGRRGRQAGQAARRGKQAGQAGDAGGQAGQVGRRGKQAG